LRAASPAVSVRWETQEHVAGCWRDLHPTGSIVCRSGTTESSRCRRRMVTRRSSPSAMPATFLSL